MRVATLHFLGVIDYPGAAEYQSDWRHTMAAGGGVLMDMIHAAYTWQNGSRVKRRSRSWHSSTRWNTPIGSPRSKIWRCCKLPFPSAYAAIHMAWGEGVGGADISGSAMGRFACVTSNIRAGGFNQPIETLQSRLELESQRSRDRQSRDAHRKRQLIPSLALYADFRDAIREDREPMAPAAAGARALEIVLGAYASAVTGQVVTSAAR